MSTLSLIFFLLAALYIFGALFELPIMFDANPKTRWLIKKIGKRNLKIVIYLFGVTFLILAILFK